jgi:hypothetical protein
MSNQIRANDLQGNAPVEPKKDWNKPVLDILELERAESGISRNNDGKFSHRSKG